MRATLPDLPSHLRVWPPAVKPHFASHLTPSQIPWVFIVLWLLAVICNVLLVSTSHAAAHHKESGRLAVYLNGGHLIDWTSSTALVCQKQDLIKF